jgi:glutathione peroxidase-family protein/2-keto-4-pentenoate hydratase
MTMPMLHDFKAQILGGRDEVALSRHAGQVVLIVNTASHCGFTPQYAGLQALHARFADRGFTVLGFPCNQFGAQEPGDAAAIAAFCERRYAVTFPMFDKVEVNGEGAHPLWRWLTGHDAGEGKPVAWNFTKFLVGPDGSLVRRYPSKVDPDAIAADIEALLAQPVAPAAPHAAAVAAAVDWLAPHWHQETVTPGLPESCRPRDRAQGYAVQAALAQRIGQPVVGWKIAATSGAGQQHIGVDGPLAGRLLADRLLPPGAAVPMARNRMRVVEAEFCFRMAADLPPRAQPYTRDEVMAAVGTLHPAIEIPDSRYEDFARAGAAQLIADFACASRLVLGPPMPEGWRALDLAAHPVRVLRDGAEVARGQGANVLGDPRTALVWLANEVAQHGPGLRAGDIVTTGTCVVPVPAGPGQRHLADYGPLGTLEAVLTD